MKNSNLICFLILALSAFSGLAHAGEKVGNGGKVVACPGYALEVLDYHRSAREFGLVPIADIPGANEFVKAENLVNRIARINPTRAALYIETIRSFVAESIFLPDAQFPTTPDTNEIAYCRDGRILQVITQRKPMTSFEKRFTVNQDVWRRLSLFQRAVLLVHEAALKEALAYNYVTADGAARMNALIFSRDLNQLTRAQLDEILLSTGLLYLADPTLKNNTITEVVERVQRHLRFEHLTWFVVPYASFDFLSRPSGPTDQYVMLPSLGQYFDDWNNDPMVTKLKYGAALQKAADLRGFLGFTVNIYNGSHFIFQFEPMSAAGRLSWGRP